MVKARVKSSATAGSRTKTIKLEKIRLDGDTQSRVSLDDDVIQEYSDLMKDGHEFPPIDVVFDGADYWMYDGFHRRWGAIKAGLKEFKCRVIEGTREDARWLSYSANQGHGLKRTNDDKVKAVLAALKHPKGVKMSDRKIAEHVGVSDRMVNKYRETTAKDSQSERTGRDGRTINTDNIGKRNGKQSVPSEPRDYPPPRATVHKPAIEPEAAVAVAEPEPEPNIIGQLFERYDAFVESLVAGQPPHVVVQLKEHSAEVWSNL